MPLIPGAEPYQHDAGPVGVLLLHGYCGSPKGLRPWAEHLADAGYTVDLPRLPGHGTTWRELNLTRWPDWYAEADRSFQQLRQRCQTVVVGGLSVGGCLALRLAQEHAGEVDGLVLVNVAVRSEDWRQAALLPWARFLVPALPGVTNDIKKPGQDEGGYDKLPLQSTYSLTRLWAETNRRLAEVTQPLLVMYSPDDHLIPTSSTRAVLDGVSSTDVTTVVLEDSYHVATIDNDAPLVFERTVEFARDVAARSRT